ncbi:MAG: hypothetical protein R2912_09720 [Eubacteriales bacterium]
MRNRFSGEKLYDAALAAAVAPGERDALALPQHEVQRAADGSLPIGYGQFPRLGEYVRVVPERRDLERVVALDVFEQLLFPSPRFPAAAGSPLRASSCARLRADCAAIRPPSTTPSPIFARSRRLPHSAVRRAAACRFVISRERRSFSASSRYPAACGFLPSSRKRSALMPARLIERIWSTQLVEKRAVVAHEDELPLAAEV